MPTEHEMKMAKKWQDEEGRKSIEADLNKIKKYCSYVRVIAHTQVCPFYLFVFLFFKIYI